MIASRTTRASRDLLIGLVAVAAAFLSNLFGWSIVPDEHDPDWAGFVVAGLIVLVVAGLLFLYLIPKIKARSGNNPPAMWGLVLTLLSIPAIFVWWTGVTFVIAAAGLALGLAGWERSQVEGRKALAIVATIGGAAMFVLLCLASADDAMTDEPNEEAAISVSWGRDA